MGENWTSDFVAGVFGGVAGIVVGQPLDTIKVRMQSAAPGIYQGVVHCLRETVRREGYRALFKGMLSPVVGCAPVNATLFVTYGGMCRHFLEEDGDRELDLAEVMIAGNLAGFACAFVTTPADLLKIQLQNQTAVRGSKGYMGNVAIARELVRVSGPFGLARGLVPTLVRETPSYGIYFGAYEAVRRLLLPPLAPVDDGLLEYDPNEVGVYSQARVSAATLIAGGIGGTFAWISTYAFDVIKTKQQGEHVAVGVPRRYATMRATARYIVRTEGWTGFTRGLSACVTRGFPVNATTFYVYETGLKICERISDYFEG